MKPLTILFEDARALVVAKPPGMLTVAPPLSSGRKEETLVDRLRREGREALAVHRLDEETSGVCLLAKDAGARELLMDLFKAREVAKTYVAVVQGRLRQPEGTLRFPIKDLGARAVVAPDGQPAETRYRVLEEVGGASIVEIDLKTGRHNQARIHFAHIGHPLVGERKYARGKDAQVRHKRAALHASRIRLHLPWEKSERTFEAPLPIDLQNLLARLRTAPGRPAGVARKGPPARPEGPAARRDRG